MDIIKLISVEVNIAKSAKGIKVINGIANPITAALAIYFKEFFLQFIKISSILLIL